MYTVRALQSIYHIDQGQWSIYFSKWRATMDPRCDFRFYMLLWYARCRTVKKYQFNLYSFGIIRKYHYKPTAEKQKCHRKFRLDYLTAYYMEQNDCCRVNSCNVMGQSWLRCNNLPGRVQDPSLGASTFRHNEHGANQLDNLTHNSHHSDHSYDDWWFSCKNTFREAFNFDATHQ